MRYTEQIAQQLSRNQITALIVGGVGFILSIIGAFIDIDRFLHVYLVAFLFWAEIALGGFFFMMLPYIAGARWSFSIQRLASAAARTFPLLAILFLPVLLGMGRIYPWAASGDKATWYLNGFFFFIRNVGYFALFTWLAFNISEASYISDESNSPELESQIHRMSIIGMILFFVVGSLMAFDWTMSLDPKLFSSAYGWFAMSRQALGFMALVLVAIALYSGREALQKFITTRVQGDLSVILLVTLMAFVYLSFIQYIVIWSGNVPSKANWYVVRTAGNWQPYMAFVYLMHGLAFVALLLPGIKLNKRIMLVIAVGLLFMRLADLFWLVMPSHMGNFSLNIWDLAVPVFIGGLWVAMFMWSSDQFSLLPENSEGLQNAVAHAGHGEEESYETA